jgi:hypothetical protein
MALAGSRNGELMHVLQRQRTQTLRVAAALIAMLVAVAVIVTSLDAPLVSTRSDGGAATTTEWFTPTLGEGPIPGMPRDLHQALVGSTMTRPAGMPNFVWEDISGQP